jgi:hypothetical protein
VGEPYQFSKAGRKFITAFIATMIGDAVPLEHKPAPEQVAIEIEGMMGRLPSLYRLGFATLIRAFEAGPFVFGFRRSFSRLTPEERLKYLRDFEEAENYVQRALILMVKSAVFLYYFSDPVMEAAIGYDHHCLFKARNLPDRHL